MTGPFTAVVVDLPSGAEISRRVELPTRRETNRCTLEVTQPSTHAVVVLYDVDDKIVSWVQVGEELLKDSNVTLFSPFQRLEDE